MERDSTRRRDRQGQVEYAIAQIEKNSRKNKEIGPEGAESKGKERSYLKIWSTVNWKRQEWIDSDGAWGLTIVEEGPKRGGDLKREEKTTIRRKVRQKWEDEKNECEKKESAAKRGRKARRLPWP